MALYQRAIVESEDDDIREFPEVEIPDEQLSAEDRTYKKRYGDLRRFQQQESAKLRAEIDQLKNAVTAGTRNSLNLPNSTNDGEIDKWMQEYPQVAAIVAGIANRQASAANAQLQSSVEELNARRQKMDEEYAQKKIAEIHPDFFEEIRVDGDFHEWLDQQSQMLQDALYVNSTDWKTAANVIGMYKAEKGIGKKPVEEKKDVRREAAKPISTRSRAAPTTNTEVLFRESQIANMKASEYERNEEAIEQAWREGKVLMDITGGAR